MNTGRVLSPFWMTMPRKKSLLYSATDIKIAELRPLDTDFVAISDEQTERYRNLEQ